MPTDRFSYTRPMTVIANSFTQGELDRIEAIGDALPAEEAGHGLVGGGRDLDNVIRVTRTAWIAHGPQTEWIYERIGRAVKSLNDEVYQFDLRGFSEPFQYTVYHAGAGGHYDWHVDQGELAVQRKLSLSLQLSDPASYEGCDLEIHASTKIAAAPRERGALIAFPSYSLHRVTPIRAGTRKAVVIWVTGPRFR